MLDVNKISKRYFDIKIEDIELRVEPPKLKTLKKIKELAKSKDDDADEQMIEAVRLLLSKNASGKNVPSELIDELDTDQINEILTQFFNWMSEVRKNDPN